MATDIFAKIGDIKGESLDAKHKDEIEVLSFSWGVSNAGSSSSGGGCGAGKATFQDLSIVHGIDEATPALLKACATGSAHQGRDDHPPQGRQRPAGIPHHQAERRDDHRRRRTAAPRTSPRRVSQR